MTPIISIFMIRYFQINLTILGLLLTHLSFAQSNGQSLDARLAELQALSRSHEGHVAKLLAQPSIPKTNFNLPEQSVKNTLPASNQYPEQPYIPEPDYIYRESEVESKVPASMTPSESNNIEIESSPKEQSDIEKAYDEIYFSPTPTRLEGYYFGPLIGLVFPQDGAVRELNVGSGSYTKDPYEPDTGFLLGLQVGKDFGRVRAEAEYAYHNFDASISTGTLSASIHNFLGRLIMEKEIGDRLDLRVGLGMGIGIIGLDSSVDYSGTGFAYDFIMGASYRILDQLTVQVDYRYYLSAANDHYDHMKSHIWLISAGLDI